MREALHALLSDATIAADGALPDTGVGQEWERILSPALIVTGKYGTRCSTVLTVSHRGAVNVEERTRDASGKVAGASVHAFELT
ncbi:MAG: NRDE family protein [Betaproteobacteria bacterium]